MRAVVAFAFLVACAMACSAPRVAEDRAAACSNKIDDDGDGLVDCEDPDCAGTEACEKTLVQCSNSIDDDRNGTLDCRQDSCRELPICKEAVESQCLLLPTAEGTGCPRGKGCYLTPDGRRWCALEGPSLAGGRCGEGDPSDRSQGCAAGTLCNSRKRCARLCGDDYDCTRNSICRENGRVKLCSSSCLRTSDCDPGEECVAFQRQGLTIDKGGWAHECTAPLAAIGQADIGMPCADDVIGHPTADICRPGLLCVPAPGGARCREVCAAALDGSPRPCGIGMSCFAVVPFSGQTDRFDERDAIGVCVP